MKPTLLEALDEIPPKLCRLIARKPGRTREPYTFEELMARSGLSRRTLRRIMRMDSFASCTVAEVDAYRSACGITPQNMRKHRAYAKSTLSQKTPYGHLGRGRGRQAFGVRKSIGLTS